MKRTYVLRFGAKTKTIVATPQQAAKEAARLSARGTYIRSKSAYEQPEGVHSGLPVSLVALLWLMTVFDVDD